MEEDRPDHRVHFGAMVTATWEVMRGAWPAILVAWAARGLLESIRPILQAERVITAGHSFEPQPVLSVAIGAGLAVISGLLLRWLLEPGATALRPDRRLAGYVALMVASILIQFGVTRFLTPDFHSMGRVAPRMAPLIATTVALGLGYAALALWPIGVLIGDRLSLSRALRLMGQAFPFYILACILLSLPGVVLSQFRVLTHHFHTSLPDRLSTVAIGALTTVISTVILAQIYSRRLRGTDVAGAQMKARASAVA